MATSAISKAREIKSSDAAESFRVRALEQKLDGARRCLEKLRDNPYPATASRRMAAAALADIDEIISTDVDQ